MSNLSLTDVLKIIEKDPLEFLISDDVQAFANEINSTATDVMNTKNPEYLLGMISVIQSLAASILLTNGMDESKVMDMLGDKDVDLYITFVVKTTIGLSVMEELR